MSRERQTTIYREAFGLRIARSVLTCVLCGEVVSIEFTMSDTVLREKFAAEGARYRQLQNTDELREAFANHFRVVHGAA